MPKQTNQEKAMAALIATNSVAAASKSCGLSEETLYRYLKEPQFKAEYRANRREVVENSIAYAQKLTVGALATLHEKLRSSDESIQVRSAQILLGFALKGTETADILERLEALETATEGQ